MQTSLQSRLRSRGSKMQMAPQRNFSQPPVYVCMYVCITYVSRVYVLARLCKRKRSRARLLAISVGPEMYLREGQWPRSRAGLDEKNFGIFAIVRSERQALSKPPRGVPRGRELARARTTSLDFLSRPFAQFYIRLVTEATEGRANGIHIWQRWKKEEKRANRHCLYVFAPLP